VSRKRSIQAVLATAVIGGALLASPGSAFAIGPGEVVWGPQPIVSGEGPHICLDDPGGSTSDGAQIDIYQCQPGANNELWFIEAPTTNFDGKHFWIINETSRKCLTVKGNVSTVDEPIIQYSCNTNSNEEWTVDYNAADNQWMVAKNDGDCATVEAVSQANKTPIIQYPCQPTTYPYENQRWDFWYPTIPSP
jgi:hypothetical protein